MEKLFEMLPYEIRQEIFNHFRNFYQEDICKCCYLDKKCDVYGYEKIKKIAMSDLIIIVPSLIHDTRYVACKDCHKIFKYSSKKGYLKGVTNWYFFSAYNNGLVTKNSCNNCRRNIIL